MPAELLRILAFLFLLYQTNQTELVDNKWNNPMVQNYTTSNNDVIIGQIGYFDRLIFSQVIYKSARWWSSREKIIEFPKDIPKDNFLIKITKYTTISSVRMYNQYYGDLHPKAEILKGGVGHGYVKIRLSSPWGRGFKYLVQIFGN